MCSVNDLIKISFFVRLFIIVKMFFFNFTEYCAQSADIEGAQFYCEGMQATCIRD